MLRLIQIMAMAMALTMAGCASLTASEVSMQAMRGCPQTRSLSIDSTLTTTTTRVVCEVRP